MYGENNQYQNYSNMPYDNTAAGSSGGSYGAPDEGPKEAKKSGSLLRKLGTSAACALVFGCVAGVTMSGVGHVAGRSAAGRRFP